MRRPMYASTVRCEYVSTPCARLVAADAEEAQEVLERVASDHRHAERDGRDDRDESARSGAPPGRKRRRAASHERGAPTASPPAAATEPARIRPSTPARGGERRTSRRERDLGPRRRRSDSARLAASAESAARSWWPRKDGCRQPGVPRLEDVASEELEQWRRPSRRLLHEHEPPRTSVEVAARGGRAAARRARAARTRRASGS